MRKWDSFKWFLTSQRACTVSVGISRGYKTITQSKFVRWYLASQWDCAISAGIPCGYKESMEMLMFSTVSGLPMGLCSKRWNSLWLWESSETRLLSLVSGLPMGLCNRHWNCLWNRKIRKCFCFRWFLGSHSGCAVSAGIPCGYSKTRKC